MLSYWIFSLFFFSVLTFTLQRKTILSALLSLESMILCCLFQTLEFPESTFSFIIMILIIAAAESALGLAILVAVSRAEETDKLFFLKT